MKTLMMFIASILLVACGDDKPQSRAQMLMDKGWTYTAMAQQRVKKQLEYPLTAEFSPVDLGIEDTVKGILSVTGKFTAKNAHGVPSEGSYYAIFKVDSLKGDSLIAFKIR